MTDATSAGSDVDLDAIEAELDRVERALGELADGTYWDHAPQDDAAAPDPSTADDVPR